MKKTTLKNFGLTFEDNYWLLNVLRNYLPLAFWAVKEEPGGSLQWLELNEKHRFSRPNLIEEENSHSDTRIAHVAKNLRLACKKKKAHVGELFGYKDIYVPMPGLENTVINVPFFFTEQPGWPSLSAAWKELTGLDADEHHPGMTKFVRMALSRPVLTPKALKAVIRLLEIHADHLVGSEMEPGETSTEVLKLRREILSREWTDHHWVPYALGIDNLQPRDWKEFPDLEEWERLEVGLSRIPRLALTLRIKQGNNVGPVGCRALLKRHQAQMGLIEWAREQDGCAASLNGESGLIMLTSPPPGMTEIQARLKIRDLAQAARLFVKKEYDLDASLGIGPLLDAGTPLYTSYRQALEAMDMGLVSGTPLVFYHEIKTGEDNNLWMQVQEGEQKLKQAVFSDQQDMIEQWRPRYLQSSLRACRYSQEALRVSLQNFCSQAYREFDRLHPLGGQALEAQLESIRQRLDIASNIENLGREFEHALESLRAFINTPGSSARHADMERVRLYLETNHAQPLKMSQLSQRFNLSSSSLWRQYKARFGKSPQAALLEIRLETAQRLLKTSSLSVADVAARAGFSTARHLRRSLQGRKRPSPSQIRLASSGK